MLSLSEQSDRRVYTRKASWARIARKRPFDRLAGRTIVWRHRMQALAILVAAGRGERMGRERPKAFLEIDGQPLVLRAARAFEAAPCVDAIVAVVPAAELEAA